jgi:hypothetical protein
MASPLWNNPLPTFTNGGTPTATQLNQYLQNMEWLHALPKSHYEQSSTADVTTSGTTWGTINANFATTIVTSGGPLDQISKRRFVPRQDIFRQLHFYG